MDRERTTTTNWDNILTEETFEKNMEIPDASHSQESNLELGMETKLFDQNIPIAVRKWVKSCTQHPISSFVTYEHLSNSIQALVANLVGVKIPNNIQEAWENPNWRKTIRDEMHVLEKKRYIHGCVCWN